LRVIWLPPIFSCSFLLLQFHIKKMGLPYHGIVFGIAIVALVFFIVGVTTWGWSFEKTDTSETNSGYHLCWKNVLWLWCDVMNEMLLHFYVKRCGTKCDVLCCAVMWCDVLCCVVLCCAVLWYYALSEISWIVVLFTVNIKQFVEGSLLCLRSLCWYEADNYSRSICWKNWRKLERMQRWMWFFVGWRW